jgi:hypothetical protein
MKSELIQYGVIALVTLISTFLANRVSLAVMQSKIDTLQKNDADKETRLRVVEHSTTMLEARAGK